MERLDNLPEKFDADDAGSATDVLNAVTQDLRLLQQDVIAQLSQDVKRLQFEKSRLLRDIEKLQAQQEMLQSEHDVLLTQKQLAQQQVWAKQLAQALAAHLQAILIKRLNQQGDRYSQGNAELPIVAANGNSSEEAQRLLSSLDATVNRTLTALRHDLTSYQSSLSQQIGRMQTLEQQGEAILQALVSRLSQQLQAETARTQSDERRIPTDASPTNGHGHAPRPYVYPAASTNHSPISSYPPPSSIPLRSTTSPILPIPPVSAPEPTIAPPRGSRPRSISQFWLGFWLIVLSTLALSLHNVGVRVIGSNNTLLGVFDVGGYISLASLGNSLLILFMRMLFVAPGMAVLAGFLYPSSWKDIKVFAQSRDRSSLLSVVGSGFFLFLSQVLIYISFGQFKNPGIPVTILFMYPIITVPLAWWLFGDRPSRLRFGVMIAVLVGVLLAASPSFTSAANFSLLGFGTAVASGAAFALYLISMQISFRKLHPVPVSVIQFTTILVLTSFSLFLPLQPQVLSLGGFLVSVLVLGLLTLVGYLLNNFGVRYMGAAQASIIASTGPVVTAILAWALIGANILPIQVLGILIVTLGVVALGVEKYLLQKKVLKATK